MRSATLDEAKIQKLLAELRATFHSQEFDAARIVLVAEYDSPRLMTVLEGTIPACRKYGRKRSRCLREAPIRRVLTKLARQYFTTDQYGWWRLKQNPSEGAYYDVES